MEHEQGMRPLPHRLENLRGELALFLLLPERRIFLLPLTFIPSVKCTHAFVLHIDQVAITNLLNSLCSQVPRVRALPSTRAEEVAKAGGSQA